MNSHEQNVILGICSVNISVYSFALLIYFIENSIYAHQKNCNLSEKVAREDLLTLELRRYIEDSTIADLLLKYSLTPHITI